MKYSKPTSLPSAPNGELVSQPKSRDLLAEYMAGEGRAADAIFDRYLQRLLALARTRISPKLRRRIDAEDVVQSAYRSFFVHANDGRYNLDRSGDLWRLLAATTLNKLRGQIEKQTAAKRSINQEENFDAIETLAARQPTIVDVIAVGEQLSLAMGHLTDDQRTVLAATLQGQSVEEISRTIGKSQRTVRRLLSQAKQEFERHLLNENAPKTCSPAASQLAIANSQAPLRFEDFVLEKLLGSGGMGKVYRAKDRRSSKKVAVKSLHKARQSDPRAVAQFVQEANILSKLRHPNIVGVEGLGRFPGGGFFLVMEFIDGTDLQHRLKPGPLPTRDAIAICRDVAAAVQHAHEHGIIHCDLKPANVMLAADGRVVVTDFGFAHMLTERSDAATASIGGTAGFLPPELLNFSSHPTTSTDIYSLGALLWRMITGVVPDGVEDVHSNIGKTSSIAEVCRRCLARQPEERYTAVADFIDELNCMCGIDANRRVAEGARR